jgi:hypothetical protein
MLDPGPNPVPEPECITVPVSLRLKVAVPAPVPQHCIAHVAIEENLQLQEKTVKSNI